MSQNKRFDELKSTLLKKLSEATNYQDLTRHLGALVSELNKEYYYAPEYINLDFDRPQKFIHLEQGESLVIHDGRILRSKLEYDVHTVYKYQDELVIHDNRGYYYFEQPPEKIVSNLGDRTFFSKNGFEIQGYIVKAVELLTQQPELRYLPKRMEDVQSDLRMFSIDFIKRPLGNLYYDRNGYPCEKFDIPNLKVDVWGYTLTRETTDREFTHPCNHSQPPNEDEMQSCDTSVALKKGTFYVLFERNKPNEKSHIQSLVLSVLKDGEEPEHHLKFVYFSDILSKSDLRSIERRRKKS